LVERLASHVGVDREDPSTTINAIGACAAEIHRFAKRVTDVDTRETLDRFADLLLEAASAMAKHERRWSRIAFDLHDGAQQEISALRLDLSRFANHLKKPLRDEKELTQALASASDLDARLEMLDAGLRQLVGSFDSPMLAERPLHRVVEELVSEFTEGTRIGVSLGVKGDLRVLTRSQRIAVQRVVAEALANVRQHSGATRARVSVRLRARRVYVVVRDNGRGFDVKRALTRATRREHLGLIAMTERARLLGGKLVIQSAPGGPTTISLTLPAGDVGDSKKIATSRRKNVRAS